jgi:hypothetical protein
MPVTACSQRRACTAAVYTVYAIHALRHAAAAAARRRRRMRSHARHTIQAHGGRRTPPPPPTPPRQRAPAGRCVRWALLRTGGPCEIDSCPETQCHGSCTGAKLRATGQGRGGASMTHTWRGLVLRICSFATRQLARTPTTNIATTRDKTSKTRQATSDSTGALSTELYTQSSLMCCAR